MTQDEKVQALIEAAKWLRACCNTPETADNKKRAMKEIDLALAAFEPEPELEYVLPAWEELPQAHRQMDDTVVIFNLPDIKFASGQISKEEYNGLRELTRVPKKPKGREWWIVPESWLAYSSQADADKARADYQTTVLVREVLDDTP